MIQDMNNKRLIEVASLFKQVSLDSVHEKNVMYGHIPTLQVVDWNIKAMEKPIC